MKAAAMNGREIDLDEHSVDDLRIRLKGPVLAGGDAGYEESRTVWNATIDRRPYVPRVDHALGEILIAHAARIRSPHSIVFLMQIGGALNSLDADHSPVGNRDARDVFLLLGSWERPDGDAANITWAREAWADMRPFSTGGTYLNFLSEDEGHERIEAALGAGLPRLAEIKARWDPENVFRTNRNIEPAR